MFWHILNHSSPTALYVKGSEHNEIVIILLQGRDAVEWS